MGCPLFRGSLSIEVNGRPKTVRTFTIVRYIMGVLFSGVSVKRGSTVFFNTEAIVTFADIRMLLSGRRVALCYGNYSQLCVVVKENMLVEQFFNCSTLTLIILCTVP